MFSFIKRKLKSAWNWIKKHFHEIAAVSSAVTVMCTMEVFGFLVVDTLLLPIAMVSIIGLIAILIGYVLVMYASIMAGIQTYDYIYEKLDFSKKYAIIEETTDFEPDLAYDSGSRYRWIDNEAIITTVDKC